MALLNLKGLGVALVTPFNKDLSIDFNSLGRIIDHIIDGGADYIVVLGTTAETPTLNLEERILITDFVRQKVEGKIPLVIGIGGNCTKRVCDEISNRDLTGYSAILSVTPYYNKPTQEGLYQHFKNICEASPLPIVLYNVPGRTGVNLTAKTTLRLSQFENIIGVKEASGNLDQINEIIKNAPDNFKVISGNDSDTISIIKSGGQGVISVVANALPAFMKDLVMYCQKRQWGKAEELQLNISKLISHIFEEGNPAGIKALLSKLGFCENIVRLPLVPVSETVEHKLQEELSKIKIVRNILND